MLRISAVRKSYRIWLRSSSIHEPSDPPARLEYFLAKKIVKNGKTVGGDQAGAHQVSAHPHEVWGPFRFASLQPRTKHNCSAKHRRQRSRIRLRTGGGRGALPERPVSLSPTPIQGSSTDCGSHIHTSCVLSVCLTVSRWCCREDSAFND